MNLWMKTLMISRHSSCMSLLKCSMLFNTACKYHLYMLFAINLPFFPELHLSGTIAEVFTVPPHSRWIPGGIHVISMWIPSIPYGIVWLRAQPFWRMIPYSFHMETPWNLNIPWNISLESRWNEHGIHHNSFHGFHIIPDGFHIIPDGFHIILNGFHIILNGFHVIPDGFHNISHGFHIIPYGFHIIPHYSTWTPHYFRWIPYYFIFIPYYFTWIPYYSRWIPCRWPNNM